MEGVVPPAYTVECVRRGGLRRPNVVPGGAELEVDGADLRHFRVTAADELPRREEERSLRFLLVALSLIQPFRGLVAPESEKRWHLRRSMRVPLTFPLASGLLTPLVLFRFPSLLLSPSLLEGS